MAATPHDLKPTSTQLECANSHAKTGNPVDRGREKNDFPHSCDPRKHKTRLLGGFFRLWLFGWRRIVHRLMRTYFL